MSDSVIVVMGNGDYLSQIKATLVNCRRQGNWQGDFCLLAWTGYDPPPEIEQRGISVFRAPDGQFMQARFHLFGDYFQRWQRVLSIDCDVLVQGDLPDLFDGLARNFPKMSFDSGLQAEDRSVLENWEYFDASYGPGKAAHPELYERLKQRFVCWDKLVFTADAMFFSPQTVPPGTVEQLKAVEEEFREANLGHIDQPVIAAVLYDQIVPMTKDYCCFFAFDDPCNRLAARGWRGDEFPALLHYTNWFAPWLVKTPDAGGYFNHRLDRVCHELYAENLAAFEEVFPLV